MKIAEAGSEPGRWGVVRAPGEAPVLPVGDGGISGRELVGHYRVLRAKVGALHLFQKGIPKSSELAEKMREIEAR